MRPNERRLWWLLHLVGWTLMIGPGGGSEPSSLPWLLAGTVVALASMAALVARQLRQPGRGAP